MKIIYSGLESSGKSLKLAMTSYEILLRNASWGLKFGIPRPIASNLKYSAEFEKLAKDLGVPIIYWKNCDELVELENCDVIMDEVGNYFDARMWQDLSLDVRRWLTQGAKCGIELYGSAQDFAQVDKSFRRLVNKLYLIRKMIGSGRPSAFKPPIRRVWGICYVRELEPNSYDEDKIKVRGIIPSFFLIKKQFCDIFDTNQKIVRSAPAPLKKVVRKCPEDGFVQVRYY